MWVLHGTHAMPHSIRLQLLDRAPYAFGPHSLAGMGKREQARLLGCGKYMGKRCRRCTDFIAAQPSATEMTLDFGNALADRRYTF